MKHSIRPALVFAVLCLLTAPASAQIGPIGSEFQVNSYTPGIQLGIRAVECATNGDFVAVWGGGYSSVIPPLAQRFSSDGSPTGTEFAVNTTTAYATYAGLAVHPSGDFVVVWDGKYDGDYGIGGQRFASDGSAIGSEFLVNSYTSFEQSFPQPAVYANGDFIVTWHSEGIDTQSIGVFLQRFGSDGSPQGSEFQVTTATATYASNVVLGANGFVVVWQSEDGDDTGIFGQRFASDGSLDGTEFQVNAFTTYAQGFASVAAGPSGDFIVAWTSEDQDGSDAGIFARRYDSTGAPNGDEFQVNTYTYANQRVPDVALLQNGEFVIAYDSGDFYGMYHPDGSEHGVFAQHFASDGTAIGGEFQVNTYTTGGQLGPSVARQGSGGFVVVWNTFQSPMESDLFGQRFSVPTATSTATATETATATVTTTATATPTATAAGAVCAATPISGCATPVKAVLKIKGGDPAKHALIWKWIKGTEVKTSFGDPSTGTTEYRLCVYDDGNLVMSPGLTADGNWTELTKGFKYKNTNANSDGLTKAILKEGTGNAKIIVKGKGSSLLTALPFTQATAVTVQLVKDPAGGAACWESVLPAMAVKSDADGFKDKIP